MGGDNTCGERERAKGESQILGGGCKRGGWFGGSSSGVLPTTRGGGGGRNKVTKFTTKYARWRDDGSNNKRNDRMVCKNERGL